MWFLEGTWRCRIVVLGGGYGWIYLCGLRGGEGRLVGMTMGSKFDVREVVNYSLGMTLLCRGDGENYSEVS